MELTKQCLKTLLYSDIFSVPLSAEEIYKFLITTSHTDTKISIENIKNCLKKNSFVKVKNNYYGLKTFSVEEKKELYKVSLKKITIAKTVGRLLIHIPTIQFIGVSGAVSAFSAKKNDDIDLFIICSPETVWITRLMTLFVIQLLGKRRTYKSFLVKDMFCVNMILDSNILRMEKKRQEIYTAHEILQLYPLIQKDSMYKRFIQKNKWTRYFLANAYKDAINTVVETKPDTFFQNIFLYLIYFLKLEIVARKFQVWYMKSKKTNETITDSLLAFHPFDYRNHILNEYNKRIKKYGL